ncbi:hypothetical protein F9K94_22905 [Brucella tritici]|uniref:Uncharacterized protein n=1 Tax=Brucella tritici TaxID=94626 RepID=A0A7V7VQQ8_9HYPH|nr:hypothetical protein F9K94_22905 [Brucella tritici]
MTTAAEIAEKIAADQSVTKAQAKSIVDGVFKAIADAAASGAETSIPGFGKFKVKATPGRDGRKYACGDCGAFSRRYYGPTRIEAGSCGIDSQIGHAGFPDLPRERQEIQIPETAPGHAL